jgi:tRNA A37 threonylcarbamoyltransferase TsaD
MIVLGIESSCDETAAAADNPVSKQAYFLSCS